MRGPKRKTGGRGGGKGKGTCTEGGREGTTKRMISHKIHSRKKSGVESAMMGGGWAQKVHFWCQCVKGGPVLRES